MRNFLFAAYVGFFDLSINDSSWNICFNKALENFLKLESSPLKISTSLSSPSWTSYCDVKSISFPPKASIVKEQSTHLDGPGFCWRFRNLVYQIPGVLPRGAQMPRPRHREPEQMPRGCPGGIIVLVNSQPQLFFLNSKLFQLFFRTMRTFQFDLYERSNCMKRREKSVKQCAPCKLNETREESEREKKSS